MSCAATVCVEIDGPSAESDAKPSGLTAARGSGDSRTRCRAGQGEQSAPYCPKPGAYMPSATRSPRAAPYIAQV